MAVIKRKEIASSGRASKGTKDNPRVKHHHHLHAVLAEGDREWETGIEGAERGWEKREKGLGEQEEMGVGTMREGGCN